MVEPRGHVGRHAGYEEQRGAHIEPQQGILLHRFAPACRKDPGTLGLRVPRLPEHLAALGAITRPVMQSSANMSGGTDATAIAEVPRSIIEGADLVLDGGQLPGTPSTVVDLRDFDSERRWHILREGAMERGAVQGVLEELR